MGIGPFFFISYTIMKNVATTLSERLKSLVNAMGYEFVGCELQGQSRHAVLRIYIDTDKGVTLTDCSKISQQVSAMLDVEDPIQGQYSLEVSSPGLNRPLFELAHYQKQIGKRIKVRACANIHKRRNFAGVLVRVEGNDIHLLVDGEEIVLPFADIEKANVIETAARR
jgi:ribosome maturation factor RimP